MTRLNNPATGYRLAYTAVFLFLLGIAFCRCYQISHDLHWAADYDYDRDMSFVQNTLNGRFGHDPSYRGAWLWYNPLLFSVETLLVKVTGLPINVVIVRA